MKLTNTGSMAGAEVVQIYTRPIKTSISRPKALRGFTRVFLESGAETEVELYLDLKGV
jgi:beta-glucosidase